QKFFVQQKRKFLADYSITMELVEYLISIVKPTDAVLDLGAGFSSIILRQHVDDVMSADHDDVWLAFVRELLGERGLSQRDLVPIDVACRWPGPYDLICVDHGPTFQDRLNDLPWILAKGRRVIFDDCRLAFGDDLQKALIDADCLFEIHGADRPFAVVTPSRYRS
ncbi:MAG: hypothetical protein GTO41_02330, partial [Burkholderiales bacterium]|nr:hypothetical protein [Burkholderiales bacterium]